MDTLKTLKSYMVTNDTSAIKSIFQQCRDRILQRINHLPEYSSLPIDELAQSLLPRDTPSDCVPIKTRGDGNCLYNAISIAISGKSFIFIFVSRIV